MLTRRLGRLEYQSSVLMFGAAKLGNTTQETADASIRYAVEQGVNHFDTAASYGHSEERMGPSMSQVRRQIFLATQTGERTKLKAKEQIYRSLDNLQVDFVDLIQLHAVCDMADLDLCTAKGGALEALFEAKDEGIVKAIGITGHTHQAPSVHYEALQRFPFDTVLAPFNYHLYSNPQYREDFDKLAAEVKKQDAALRVIKAVAKGPWRDEQRRKYDTWYEPFDDQKLIDACVHFVLFREDIVAFASAGDVSLFAKIVNAVEKFGYMTQDEVEQILSRVSDYASPFGAFAT